MSSPYRSVSLYRPVERIDTAEQALAVLDRVFDDYREDTVVSQCQYTGKIPNGLCAVCLIGTALALHGVSLDALRSWDLTGDGRISALNDHDGLPLHPDDFIGPDALSVFQHAQDLQDDAVTWGDAVQRTKDAWRKLAREEADRAYWNDDAWGVAP